MDDFQRQQSVWNLVKENVPYSELSEIRGAIGDTLIDMYTELCSEVQMWKKIWQEIHDSEQGSRPETPVFPLADPPAIKELLKAEIQLLLLTLRERAARHGRDAEEFMAQYNPNVVSYALGSSSTQRQESPKSCWETAKSPSRPPSSLSEIGSRPLSRLSSYSSCEEEIKTLRHKLNITHIDEVVSHLRSVLTEECEALKRDVMVLQENIETERRPVSPDPTVAELKEERRIIQRDLKAQILMSSSQTPNNLTIRNPQIHHRESHKLASSANDFERIQHSNHKTVPPTLKPCPPRDVDHLRRAVSPKEKDRLSPHRTLDPHLDHHPSGPNNTETINSPLNNHIRLINDNSSNVELNSFLNSTLECDDRHRRNSVRASAFRLIPAASVGTSGSTQGLIKPHASKDGELAHLQPAPPAVQRPSRGGQRGRRYLCVPQHDQFSMRLTAALSDIET
ncbi:coiled-coil domain-containing protein 24 [Paramisgurnus dabryanus]|uniref:coiled-coil domain-containing protein 24 n=1 Tax=Paramisgurnus dabryanus TaxID=90735 RepID=UPI0031F389FE